MKSYPLTLQTALMVSALAACGQGTMIYDQQSATNRTVSGYGYPFQVEQPAGQSFTPTLSSVGFVQLEFDDPYPGNGVGATVYVNLRADSLTGPILGSTDPVSMPDGFPLGVTNFFFGTLMAITPGQTYYVQPVLESGEGQWIILAGPFSYTGGTFFEYGSPDPNGYNAWFREGTLTPEPSCGLLLLGGAAGMWAAGRLRRLRCGRLLLILIGAGTLGTWAAFAQTTQTNRGIGFVSLQHAEWPEMPVPTDGCAVIPIPGQPGMYWISD